MNFFCAHSSHIWTSVLWIFCLLVSKNTEMSISHLLIKIDYLNLFFLKILQLFCPSACWLGYKRHKHKKWIRGERFFVFCLFNIFSFLFFPFFNFHFHLSSYNFKELLNTDVVILIYWVNTGCSSQLRQK